MAQPAGGLAYARALRALGQALEDQGISEFDLHLEGDAYVIKGQQEAPAPRGAKPSSPQRQDAPTGGLSSLLRGLFGQRREQPQPQGPVGAPGPAPRASTIELRYSWADLERLDHEGQARRRDPSGMPDAYRLSQLLRVVGAQLDTVQGRLVALARHGPVITVEYETAEGERRRDDRTVAALYEAWVRMYLRRSERPAS
jgi:hypothetical protein